MKTAINFTREIGSDYESEDGRFTFCSEFDDVLGCNGDVASCTVALSDRKPNGKSKTCYIHKYVEDSAAYFNFSFNKTRSNDYDIESEFTQFINAHVELLNLFDTDKLEEVKPMYFIVENLEIRNELIKTPAFNYTTPLITRNDNDEFTIEGTDILFCNSFLEVLEAANDVNYMNLQLSNINRGGESEEYFITYVKDGGIVLLTSNEFSGDMDVNDFEAFSNAAREFIVGIPVLGRALLNNRGKIFKIWIKVIPNEDAGSVKATPFKYASPLVSGEGSGRYTINEGEEDAFTLCSELEAVIGSGYRNNNFVMVLTGNKVSAKSTPVFLNEFDSALVVALDNKFDECYDTPGVIYDDIKKKSKALVKQIEKLDEKQSLRAFITPVVK